MPQPTQEPAPPNPPSAESSAPAPDAPASAASSPKADLGRLRIERREDEPARVRGFPLLRVVLVLGVVALGFLFRAPLMRLVGGDGSRPLRTARAAKIVPGQAQEGDVSSNGYIVADRQASLATVLSGRLVELAAAEGDMVEKGAIVARIQYDDLEVQEQQAIAARRSAEARLAQIRANTATARARVTEAEKEHTAAILVAARLDAEINAQKDVVASATENRDRLLREVERNRLLREKKFVDAETWDRVQTAARTGQLDLDAATKRMRALEAGRKAWDGQVARRLAASAVAQAAVLAAGLGEDVAQAAVAEAEQAEKLAGIMLEKTRIRAPFTGLVIRKDAEKGEVIAPTGAGNSRGSVLTIVDPTSLEVQVELSERRIARVREGDRAVVFLDADPDTALPGAVRKIWPRADRSKGSIEVRVKLDAIPSNLRPEMAARVIFKGMAKGEGRAVSAQEAYVTVPLAALTRRSGNTVVFVVQGDVVRGVQVDKGAARGASVVITQGLKGGELLVLDPPESLQGGDTVELAK